MPKTLPAPPSPRPVWDESVPRHSFGETLMSAGVSFVDMAVCEWKKWMRGCERCRSRRIRYASRPSLRSHRSTHLWNAKGLQEDFPLPRVFASPSKPSIHPRPSGCPREK